MHSSRGSTGFGLSPTTYYEIEAWSRLYNTPLKRWEVSILRQMDAAFLRVAAEMQEKYNPKPKQTQLPKRRAGR